MKLKLLGAALLAVAMAAPAYADINTGSASSPNPGNGELFLSVWHTGADGVVSADDTSYTLDLGVSMNDFVSATTTPTVNAIQPGLTYSADALMTSFLAGAADVNSITWNIVALDTSGTRRLLTTADVSFTGTTQAQNQVYNTVFTAQTYLGNVNAGLAGAQDTLNNGSVTFMSADAAYAGDGSFGATVTSGPGLNFNTTGGLGDTLAFWALSANSVLTPVIDVKLDGYGWTLASNGTLSYGALAAPVPEADTYALLLAGLGLVGFMARRRKLA